MDWKIFVKALSEQDKKELEQELSSILCRNLSHLTPSDQWAGLIHCSRRLQNILLSREYGTDNLQLPFIEQIQKHEFLRVRNAGKLSWQEFIELRGY